MDYGEKHDSETRFNGTGENLDLGNWAPERDPKNLGEQAISSSVAETEQVSEDNLGQIVELTPAPAEPNANVITQGAQPKNLQPIVGNHFNDAVVAEIHRAEDELSQTQNISNFYDEIRDMAEIAGEHWAA